MSAEEFLEWQAFDAIDPLPDRRADLQFAATTAALMNALSKRKDGEPWRAADFLLFDWPPPPAPGPAPDLGAQLRAAFAAHNARLS